MIIKGMRRHAALAAFACAAVLATGACGSSSGTDDAASQSADGALERSSVSVAVFPTLNALGAYTAQHEGFFDKEGLKAELATASTPAEAMPQLLGGKVQFALMDVTTPTLARAKGVPAVLAAPGGVGTELRDGMGVGNIWTRADSKIKTIKDIENATFGVPQINSQMWIDVRQTIDEAGGDSSTTKFVEVPNQLAALKAGNVDVTTTSEPGGTAALADKSIKLLSGYVAAGGDLAYAFVTTEEFARENPNTVRAFEAAIIAGNKAANAGQAKRAQVASTYVKADKELLDKAVYPKFGEEPIVESSVRNTIDRVVKYGLLEQDKAPKPSDLLIPQK